MTDDVPDSDPHHIDPAGDLADLIESGDFDLSFSEEQDTAEIRDFLQTVQEIDDPDPGTVAAARIARQVLRQSAEKE